MKVKSKVKQGVALTGRNRTDPPCSVKLGADSCELVTSWSEGHISILAGWYERVNAVVGIPNS